MYRAAAGGGHPDCAELLMPPAAGVHHELPIKGNGERGTTSLQEAVAPSPSKEEGLPLGSKLAVARLLIDYGAFYDVYSACALNDTFRLHNLIGLDTEVVNAAAGAGTERTQ